jgi:glycosyltransferase involved in cell wall biosynthesis
MVADNSERMERMLRTAAAGDSRIVVGDGEDRAGVEQMLRRIDVICCPSMSFENGPTIALEAQAMGTPVIGSRVGAMPEIITDRVNGRLVSPGDWQHLAQVLAEIADRPAIVDGWREALPRPRTMDDVAEDYLALYGAREAAAAHR